MIASLEDVLAPLSVAEFVSQFWGRRPLYIRGTPEKFASLYSVERFIAVLERPTSVLGNPKVSASIDPRGESGANGASRIASNIAPTDARKAYERGATVCMNRLDEHEPALAELVTKFRVALGNPGDMHVNAYWSPSGQGFLPHFDARIATTFQIHGTKTWRFGKQAAIAWPHDNAFLERGIVEYDLPAAREGWEQTLPESALSDLQEVELRPGDFLCLPAGCVHEAMAGESSFALNFTFNRLPVAVYLSALLARRFGARSEWRGVAPLSPRFDGPGSGEEALRARIGEAIEYLKSLQADPAALHEVAALELASTAVFPGPTEVSAPLAPETPLRASPFLVFATRPEAEPLVVVARGQRIEASGMTARLFRALLERRRTTAVELAGVLGLGVSSLLESLSALEGAGCLERAAD